jgi:hypothetical protein
MTTYILGPGAPFPVAYLLSPERALFRVRGMELRWFGWITAASKSGHWTL